ncbi:MAG: RagB/SusD family nutrient uptake outer membrane protein [Lachnoclostridium sp.]|nr:RagB/SusD family nutrient uptake outer membrane protein [Lachnoclostridium sp.]
MKITKYIGFGCALLALSSCSDFLDADNKSNANQNGFDVVSQDPNVLRAVAYNSLKSFATNTEMTEIGTDFYRGKPGNKESEYGTYLMVESDKNASDFYKNAYSLINYANALLRFGASDPKLCQEGIFIRSLGYYFLTQQFGAVPYVDYYIADSNRDYPRMPLSELYPQIIADLEGVYNDCALPATAQTGEATKQAVAALIAKFYLAAGWDLDTAFENEVKGTYTVKSTTNFTQAAKYAELAINGVKLTMPFAQKWSPFNQENNEVIFAVKYQRAGYPGDVSSSGHSLQNNYINLYGNCLLTGQKGTSGGGSLLPTYKAVRLFEEGDERFEGTFMTTYYNAKMDGANAKWDATNGYMAFYNATDEQKRSLPIAFKYYPYWVDAATVEAEMAAMKDQLKAGSSYSIKDPEVVIIDYPNCTRYYVNADGSIKSSETITYDKYMSVEKTVYGVRKWDDPESDNVTKSNDYRDIPLLHVSDMYLVAAEAYLLAGQEPQALAKINDVRTRAKVKALNSFGEYENLYQYTVSGSFGELRPIDVILDERARELYAERTRWMDLRRTKQLVRYNVEFNWAVSSAEDMKGPDGAIKWLRPIPENEFLSNTALTKADQNPGYSTGEEEETAE